MLGLAKTARMIRNSPRVKCRGINIKLGPRGVVSYLGAARHLVTSQQDVGSVRFTLKAHH